MLQNDMLFRMAALPEISGEDGMESFKKLMTLFTSPEIIAWLVEREFNPSTRPSSPLEFHLGLP